MYLADTGSETTFSLDIVDYGNFQLRIVDINIYIRLILMIKNKIKNDPVFKLIRFHRLYNVLDKIKVLETNG